MRKQGFQATTLSRRGSCRDRIMAEREGFEPSVGSRPQRFSRPPRSTTPAPLPSTGFALTRAIGSGHPWNNQHLNESRRFRNLEIATSLQKTHNYQSSARLSGKFTGISTTSLVPPSAQLTRCPRHFFRTRRPATLSQNPLIRMLDYVQSWTAAVGWRGEGGGEMRGVGRLRCVS